MSFTASNSSKDPILPLSVASNGEEKERERFVKDGDERLFRGSAMTRRGAYAAVSYMSCAGRSFLFLLWRWLLLLTSSLISFAVLLVLFNKAALSSYKFPSANVITLCQMICSCSFLYVLRRWKVISFSAGESLATSDGKATFVPFEIIMRTLPLSAAYLFYMLVTMESVRGVNVPMYTTLRRTTVMFTMIVEYILAGMSYTPPIVGSVGLIVFGAIIAGAWDLSFNFMIMLFVGLIVFGAFIAGARDLSFDFYGYSVVFLANISTAIYLASIGRVGKSSGLNSFGLMWCNGIICGPVLLLLTFLRGELETTMNFPHLFSAGFLAVLLLSCMLAFFLNYSIFLNTSLNSALTQTICGNLKDLFTIGLGWIFFGGLPFDIFNVIGQLLGFVGSGLYAYYKLIGR